mmetsp:Transcript_13776/g.24972  ORF Transcript_13776/g.24972 Transcript_13776/m.24972 type:complete len:87 (+) Transcript_13776:689-949(+)
MYRRGGGKSATIIYIRRSGWHRIVFWMCAPFLSLGTRSATSLDNDSGVSQQCSFSNIEKGNANNIPENLIWWNIKCAYLIYEMADA